MINVMSRRVVRFCEIGAVSLAAAGCASNGPWFSAGPHPASLSGTWIDQELSTARDTVAWILDSHGSDRTLHLSMVTDQNGRPNLRRREVVSGIWYTEGDPADSAARTLCHKRRARDGGSCVHYQLDTVTVNQVRLRRLTMFDFTGRARTPSRVLLERLP